MKNAAYAKYADDPVLNGQHENPAIMYVMGILNDVAFTPSGGGGMGYAFHTIQDIRDYQREMGVKIDPLFKRAILLASRTRSNARAEHEQELSQNG